MDDQGSVPQGRALRSEAELHALGQRLRVTVTDDPFLTEDSFWRLTAIYQRYLASHLLPREGTLIDIGAGFGALTLPFAKLMPHWTVWAFEPDPKAFAALQRNVADLELGNVVAVNTAVRGGLPVDSAISDAIAAKDADTLGQAPATPFRQALDKPGFVEAAATNDAPRPGMSNVHFATIPASALSALAPTALKVVAPGAEQGIFDDIGPCPAHVFGEMWHPASSRSLISPDMGAAQIHLPLAGTPLILRHGQALPSVHKPGLDVVVALYNNADYVAECVRSIIDNPCDEICALVVDDGSTDTSAQIVRDAFGDEPRVKLLQKSNGGCASARNFGRNHSQASHIAFVDSDDAVNSDFFPKLLELARYSGSEIVQGRFEKMEISAMGDRILHRSYEDEALAHHPRIGFGDAQYFVAPAHELITGQPAIWRRIYRRDFLDHRNIWFPEHIRAFDDQIFQLLTLYLARDVYCREDCAYLYRQHPGQDIKAGDERWFYSLEMFRLVGKRAIAEGWNDMVPVFASFVNTVNWIYRGLRDDLKDQFLRGAGELWVYLEKAFGRDAFGPVSETAIEARGFRDHADATRYRLRDLPEHSGWVHLDASTLHPDIVRAMR